MGTTSSSKVKRSGHNFQLLLQAYSSRKQRVAPLSLQDAIRPARLAPDEVFDVIIGSDCLYNTSAIEQLSVGRPHNSFTQIAVPPTEQRLHVQFLVQLRADKVQRINPHGLTGVYSFSTQQGKPACHGCRFCQSADRVDCQLARPHTFFLPFLPRCRKCCHVYFFL